MGKNGISALFAMMGFDSQMRSAAIGIGYCWLAGCLAACGGQEGSTATSSSPADFSNTLLSAHNQVRAAVTLPVGYAGTWAPLPRLSWSSALEASAQSWVNTLRDSKNCVPSHDDTSPYGENIAGGTVGYTITMAFEAWAAEMPSYAFSPVYAFDKSTGHYTQIVWRNTTELGCAMAQCPSGYLVYSCRYNPAGNVVGAQPY